MFKLNNMKPKKSIQVVPIINWTNKQLKRTDVTASKDFKCGICAMLEKMLHAANRYEGFSFINNEDSVFNTVGYFTRKYLIKHLTGEDVMQMRYMAKANDGFSVLVINSNPETKKFIIEYPTGIRKEVSESYLSFYDNAQDPTDYGFPYEKKL